MTVQIPRVGAAVVLEGRTRKRRNSAQSAGYATETTYLLGVTGPGQGMTMGVVE